MSEPGAGARPDMLEDLVAIPNFIILYVDDPIASAAFYARLLDRPALETSPTFAMFSLHEGVIFGLWSPHTVQPGASAIAGAVEIGFTADSKEAVQKLHPDGTAKGPPMLHPPTQMDFGFTFTAADPDGHRLRVFVPATA